MCEEWWWSEGGAEAMERSGRTKVISVGSGNEGFLDTCNVAKSLSIDVYDLIMINGFGGDSIEFLSLCTKTLQREIQACIEVKNTAQ